MQSQLPTCAAGCQRVVLDAALSPVQSRLLTCAAGVVDAPVSDRSSYCSCNPVLGWGLRYVTLGWGLRFIHVLQYMHVYTCIA